MEPYRHLPDDTVDEDVAAFVGTHVNFHAVLASLTGNRVLELLLPTVGLIVTHHVVVSADPREVQEEIAHSHAEIAAAVVTGDADRAQALMEAHIVNMADVYSRRMGDRLEDYIEWR